ncbi:MAG: hypothetical protein MI924_28650 [Chloroflexales bacterium]|nr:hypothetical protein [Chloroflexales bacterium]
MDIQMAECRVTVERLLAYSDNPTIHRAEAEAALAHVRRCPSCQRRLGYLALALANAEEDQLTCQQCQDQLPEYLQAELHGQAHDLQWLPIALHLKLCPHCAAVCAELVELAAFADNAHGAEPPHYPGPDLSFLGHEQHTEVVQSAGIPWRLDDLGQVVIAFSTELLQTIRQVIQPPAPALGMRKSAQITPQRYQFALTDAVKDLEITITVEPSRDDPQHCTIVVAVQIPSRGGWPHLAGTQVTLQRGDQEQETQVTDAFGKAVFRGIAVDALPRLVFAIAPLA